LEKATHSDIAHQVKGAKEGLTKLQRGTGICARLLGKATRSFGHAFGDQLRCGGGRMKAPACHSKATTVGGCVWVPARRTLHGFVCKLGEGRAQACSPKIGKVLCVETKGETTV